MPSPGSGWHPPHRGDGSTSGQPRRTYAGWEHSWRLQRRRIGFGFLPLSQKFLCTIRLSLFRRQPYLVYWMPGRGRAWAVRQWVQGSHRLPAQPPPASPLGRVLSDVTAQVGPKRCFAQACRRCSCGCQTPQAPWGHPAHRGVHTQRGVKQTQPSPATSLPQAALPKTQVKTSEFLGGDSHHSPMSI